MAWLKHSTSFLHQMEVHLGSNLFMEIKFDQIKKPNSFFVTRNFEIKMNFNLFV